MEKGSLKIGLIGAGRIGKVHGEAISTRVDSAELAAVSDVYLPAAQALAARWRVPKVYQDHRSILDDPSMDAVAICSSTDTHARIIIEAAQAGKHIFCEKPIDHSLEKIDAALEAVEKAGVKLMVGFNRRFDPSFRRVRERVENGSIGTPRLLRITSRDPAPPPVEYIKVSGGIFLDMTIHDFDMARYLIGSEVTQVFAAGDVMVDPQIGAAGDIDTAITTLWFASGAVGAIDNCREAAYGYDQRVEVFGSAGMAQAENNTPDRHILSTKDGVISAKPLYFFLERYMEAYTAEIQAFSEAVMNDSPVPVSGADGRAAVVIGLAAARSHQEARPVKVAEIDPGGAR
jgi:myo-inositol 2-dehydrogenase / D-chiro-inositol 1-dehydrogenase